MDKRRILILGAGVMQIPALRWAAEQGWYIYVADGNPQAVGISMAHRFLHVDLSDVEGMIAAAAEVRDREGLDGVFTAGTDFSYTVARVAEALGLPGLSPEVAYRASNKAEMRTVLRRHGVSSPNFAILKNGEAEEQVLERLSFPLVVKPVDNMGSRGIRRVDTLEEYRRAFEDAGRHSRSGTVIVEEYIPGMEFSIDALVVNGEVTYTGIADRHIFFPPYFVEMGHTIPTVADDTVLAEVRKTFEAAVRALGIDNGAAKGDVKWDGERAFIGEVAARLSGGYMSGWTYPYCSGVELTGAALQQAVGRRPEGLDPVRHWVSAERAFISIPGIVEAVEGVEAAKAVPGIRDVFIRVGPGDSVDFPTNNVEKCGNCISAAPERDRAVQAAEEACRTIFVRLTPGNPKTMDFLHTLRTSRVPAAFALQVPENRAAVEKMLSIVKGNEASSAPLPPGESEKTGKSEKGENRRVAVLPLPNIEAENSLDWHGMLLPRAFRRVMELSRLELVESVDDADIILGSLFWKVFLRGGAQAAVWIVDTVRTGGTGSLKGCC